MLYTVYLSGRSSGENEINMKQGYQNTKRTIS
jgi:hypothetical protein